MDRFLKTLVFSSILVCFWASSASAQSCSSYSFSRNNVYTTCIDLPTLNSFLHWNYHQTNHTIDLAYRHAGVETSQWVCWALNPGNSGMVGSQCLVAFTNTSGAIEAYTSSVDGYGTSLQRSSLSFEVPTISAERVSNDVIIYATVALPSGSTSFNHLWQVGPLSSGTPAQHAMASANTASRGTVDFISGQTTAGGGSAGGSRLRRRNTHGVLNAISWGILLPMGAMAARYLKVFKSANPAWFYIHVACQTSAYIIGVAGWGTGIKLGNESVGIDVGYHGRIGLTLFILGTLQVFALLLRPKPDHKYRLYWNIYHHSVGYTVIVLSIINIYKGFDILDPEKKWKNAYTGILIALGAIAALLEAFTWFVVIKRKKDEKHSHVGNGTNGYA